VEASLNALKQSAAEERENLMPGLIDAARAYASEGEIVEALQTVWGDYRESPVF
jgi:methylmalonyl-CoA mutase N-terminal domain/subunit